MGELMAARRAGEQELSAKRGQEAQSSEAHRANPSGKCEVSALPNSNSNPNSNPNLNPNPNSNLEPNPNPTPTPTPTPTPNLNPNPTPNPKKATSALLPPSAKAEWNVWCEQQCTNPNPNPDPKPNPNPNPNLNLNPNPNPNPTRLGLMSA